MSWHILTSVPRRTVIPGDSGSETVTFFFFLLCGCEDDEIPAASEREDEEEATRSQKIDSVDQVSGVVLGGHSGGPN